MAKPAVLVVGSSNTDMIIQVERLPRPGETVLGRNFATVCGGKGANQAVGAACAGGNVTFVARVGNDPFGKMAVEALTNHGIDTRYVVRDRTSPSGAAMIVVAKNGQNTIAVAPGANANLSAADVKRSKDAFRDASVVLLQLETPLRTVEAAARLAAAAGARIILNPAPARSLPASLLKGVYLLTPNEVEAQLLTGVTVNSAATVAKAANKLDSRGVQNAIITMGARGVFVAEAGGERRLIAGHKVKAVDSTGAGDVFNGALAVAIGEGRPLMEAAVFANAAAAISVTRPGAQASAPTRKEIEQFLATGQLPRSASRNGVEEGQNAADGWGRISAWPRRESSDRSAKFNNCAPIP